MARLTLEEARDQLFESVVPNLSTPANIAQVNTFINLIQERYINSGKYSGMIQEVRFSTPGDYITLPRRILSVLAVRYEKDGCSSPRFIENQWYQFTVGGPGNVLQDDTSWTRYG